VPRAALESQPERGQRTTGLRPGPPYLSLQGGERRPNVMPIGPRKIGSYCGVVEVNVPISVRGSVLYA
jgi:hypothetical protein